MTACCYIDTSHGALQTKPVCLCCRMACVETKPTALTAAAWAPVPAQEYGLPSSHTLNSLCLNYFAVW